MPAAPALLGLFQQKAEFVVALAATASGARGLGSIRSATRGELLQKGLFLSLRRTCRPVNVGLRRAIQAAAMHSLHAAAPLLGRPRWPISCPFIEGVELALPPRRFRGTLSRRVSQVRPFAWGGIRMGRGRAFGEAYRRVGPSTKASPGT